MLFTFDELSNIIKSNNINITGILHIGAHNCEELPTYNKLGITNDNIIWIDALSKKVEECKNSGIPNVYNAIVTDEDDKPVIFNVSNNDQSSSVLQFKTHAIAHPDIVYVDKTEGKTITIDTFLSINNLHSKKYNFWNLDIQGAELLALKGGIKSLKDVDILYLEVNEKELYEGCGLVTDIDDFLLKLNFKRILTTFTAYGWGDAIYVKII